MADYQGVLADLRARLTSVEAERHELVTAIAAVERIVAAARPSITGGVSARSAGVHQAGHNRQPLKGLTMPQAIAAHFRASSEPQTIRQIMDGLVAGGYKKVGKNFRGHVYNTMHRLSTGDAVPYRHETDGRWSLRIWPNVTAGENRP